MTDKVRNLINEQINKEYYSAYLYLAMSDWLNQEDWPGAANWMYVQYREEMVHAEGFVRYLTLRGEKIELKAIDAPKGAWNSVLEVFEEALAHEEYVTDLIDKIAHAAEEDGDRAARLFLDWYILEQIEEEANGIENVSLWKKAGTHPGALFSLDRQYAARTFVPDEIPHLDV
ncbi:MAG TPA: ferritin [Clostridia bacterium]|nr:ferritin [Clostridia bacterium]